MCLAYLEATSLSQAGDLLSCSYLPVSLPSSPLTFLPSFFLKSHSTSLSLSPLISVSIVLLNLADVTSVTSICLFVCQAAVPWHWDTSRGRGRRGRGRDKRWCEKSKTHLVHTIHTRIQNKSYVLHLAGGSQTAAGITMVICLFISDGSDEWWGENKEMRRKCGGGTDTSALQ